MTFNSSTSPRRIFRFDRRMVFISRYVIHATWALHPPLGFIVRGSSHREPPWQKGHREVLEWGFGLIQFLCQMGTPRKLPLTECDGNDHTESSFTFE
ncbi:hypothetical protein GQ457_13G026550 [Hibiscus cannabinus]